MKPSAPLERGMVQRRLELDWRDTDLVGVVEIVAVPVLDDALGVATALASN